MHGLSTFLIRHLLESTLCGGILACVSWIVPRGACRYTLWFATAMKFVLPTVLLASIGAQLASLHPAAVWMTRWLTKLATILQLLPKAIETAVFTGNSAAWLTLWAMGVAVALVYWRLRLRDSGTMAGGAPSAYELEIFESARKRMGGKRPAQLSILGDRSVPAVRGIFHSKLTIPELLSANLTRDELEAVFLHELAHAQRRDNLTAAIVHGLTCIFWFHPLLVLAGKRMHVEREYACDDLVLASGAHAGVYANGLWKVCRLQLGEATSDCSAMSGAALQNRFRRLLISKTRRRILYASPLLLIALALLVTALPVAGGYCSQCVSNGARRTCESDSKEEISKKGTQRDEMDCSNSLPGNRELDRAGRR